MKKPSISKEQLEAKIKDAESKSEIELVDHFSPASGNYLYVPLIAGGVFGWLFFAYFWFHPEVFGDLFFTLYPLLVFALAAFLFSRDFLQRRCIDGEAAKRNCRYWAQGLFYDLKVAQTVAGTGLLLY